MYRTGPISPLCSWLTSDLLCYRFRTAIGHYTAMVWSNTNRVGCGLTEFREGKWFAKLYTCNYGPSGNYIGGQMYAQGQACSQCPQPGMTFISAAGNSDNTLSRCAGRM